MSFETKFSALSKRRQCSNVQHNPVDEGKAEEKFVHIFCVFIFRGHKQALHITVTWLLLFNHFLGTLWTKNHSSIMLVLWNFRALVIGNLLFKSRKNASTASLLMSLQQRTSSFRQCDVTFGQFDVKFHEFAEKTTATSHWEYILMKPVSFYCLFAVFMAPVTLNFALFLSNMEFRRSDILEVATSRVKFLKYLCKWYCTFWR